MQLIYEGKDITSYANVRRADLTDNADGELDSLDLILDDSKGYWSRWRPEKNHAVQVKDSGFNTGIMYIDEIGQQRGAIILRGLPVKQEAKTEYIRAWDKIRFLELAREVAGRYQLQLEAYGVQEQLYSRVDQCGADLQFLAWRCALEGYALKVTGGKLVIFSQSYMESQAAARTIKPCDIDGDFVYKDKSTQIYSACRITYQGIQGEFIAPGVYGPTLKYFDLAVGSIGEAQRFARGLLRAKNCMEKTFACTLRYDAGIAAGNTVELSGFGLADGKYLVHQVIHKFVIGKTSVKLRRPLEGY